MAIIPGCDVRGYLALLEDETGVYTTAGHGFPDVSGFVEYATIIDGVYQGAMSMRCSTPMWASV